MKQTTRREKILTARQGTNADLIADVAYLHIADEAIVADVTYGRGVFWQNVDTDRFQLLSTDLQDGVDFRDLPYDDASLDVVVLDPPYTYNPKATIKDSIADGYKLNDTGGISLRTTDDVLTLYREGMREAKRVLRDNGYLFVKCQDGIESNTQRWQHIRIFEDAERTGWYGKDLFILQTLTTPTMRWKHQLHARKNHSYLWVFQKANGQ